MTEKHASHPEVEEYGDQRIASRDEPVPVWLKFNYVFWILWGVVWFYYFWNGSYGWLDRGYWFELQKAASTTFPTENLDWPKSVPMEDPYLNKEQK